MYVIDTTMFLNFIRPGIAVPPGRDGKPIANPKGRINYLIERLSLGGGGLILPTPVIADRT